MMTLCFSDFLCNSNAFILYMSVFVHKVQQASNLLFSTSFNQKLNVLFLGQITLNLQVPILDESNLNIRIERAGFVILSILIFLSAPANLQRLA